ncbi:MAG: hypothetical protein ACP5UB_04500 [Candidatus Sumerlaeaceae bacterium]
MLTNWASRLRTETAAIALVGILIIGLGGYWRYVATAWGLPYAYSWDEPEIVNPAIRILREGVYRPTRFAYGPLNSYLHAGWGVLSVLKAVETGDIKTVWDLKTDWDTGWYWTISSPVFHRRARLFCLLMWGMTAFAVWGACRELGVRWGLLAALGLVAFSRMNFEQTSIVSVGATAAMFAALAFWGGLRALNDGTHVRKALWWTSFAAGAATASKIIFFPLLVIPVLAYFDAVRRKVMMFSYERLALWCLAPVAIFAVLMAPMFYDPPRFIHSLTTELKFYGDQTLQLTLTQHLRSAVLSALASVDSAVLAARDGQLFVKRYSLPYSIYVVLAAFGLAVLWRSKWTAAALVTIPALINLWQVSSYSREFYARNLLIAQLASAVLAAFGLNALVKSLGRWNRIALWFVFAALAIFQGGQAFVVGAMASERTSITDSRVLADEKIEDLTKKGAKVAIASELHWFFSRGDTSLKSKVHQVSVTRLLRYPEEAQDLDFAVVPLALTYGDKLRASDEALSAWAKGLATLTPQLVLGHNVTYFDCLTTDPKVGFIPGRAFKASFRRDSRRIYGFELLSTTAGQFAWPTQYGIAVPNYFLGSARLGLRESAKTLVVKARGLNPFEQEEAPTVWVRVAATTDTAAKSPVADVRFELKRSGSGLVEYTRPVDVPAGEHLVLVRANNPNSRFMTEIEYVEFR